MSCGDSGRLCFRGNDFLVMEGKRSRLKVRSPVCASDVDARLKFLVTVLLKCVLNARLLAELFIKVWVVSIKILFVQIILNQAKAFTETLEMNQFALTQETNGISYLRIFYQTKEVIIGSAGFLLWCDCVKTTLRF